MNKAGQKTMHEQVGCFDICRAAKNLDKNRPEMGARRKSAERFKPQASHDREKESENALCELEISASEYIT